MATKKTDETDDFFSKLQTGSDDARVLWADISRDKLFVGRQLNQIFNQKRAEIVKATGATEDMRELNQLYGKMELLGFLTTNLLAYPAMFAESKGMVYRPSEGADVIPITPTPCGNQMCLKPSLIGHSGQTMLRICPRASYTRC
jgi:hypothetical protein